MAIIDGIDQEFELENNIQDIQETGRKYFINQFTLIRACFDDQDLD